jgi:DNA-binding FadR family transcriptional regulator
MSERGSKQPLSEFLSYLAKTYHSGEAIPSLEKLSKELRVSVALLREQLEVARAFELVEIRPRLGIRRLPVNFSPAIKKSLAYAVAIDGVYFQYFADLRLHLEEAYWFKAVSALTMDDHDYFIRLVDQAEEKLRQNPAQVPHWEHRELHQAIYKRLDNPFVTGLLDAYWDIYEQSGLDVYADIQYLEQVWKYHRKMIEAIRAGDFDGGYRAMKEHVGLLSQRTKPAGIHQFE